MIAVVQWHPHDPVKSDPQKLLFFLPVKPDNKQRDSVVWQWLPCFDKIHLGLHQVQVFDIGMGFKDLVPQLEKEIWHRDWLWHMFLWWYMDVSYLTFDLLFRENLEATYSSTWISKVAGLMTGWLAGCCIERNAWNIQHFNLSSFNNCLYKRNWSNSGSIVPVSTWPRRHSLCLPWSFPWLPFYMQPSIGHTVTPGQRNLRVIAPSQ